jgi:arylsulfatase A-like enzyme
VPFILRWPKENEAGSQSNKTVCLTDFMATCADLLGAQLPVTAGEDSFSFLPNFRWIKKSKQLVRLYLMELL